MRKITSLVLVSALVAAGFAQAGAPATADAKPATAAVPKPAMTDGEVRKVDMESKKITIKHGEIKNLNMPGMTMVFQLKDPAMLSQVKAGDKVKFSAEKAGGAIVVTDIELAN